VVVRDFNGDNKPDLIVPIGGGNNVGVLLGQGDGTFPAAPDAPGQGAVNLVGVIATAPFRYPSATPLAVVALAA
jgi:hypothetical protein